MKPSLFASAAVALLAAASAPASAFDLRVEVLNARSNDGFVAAAVYEGAAGWLKVGEAVQLGRVAVAAEKAVLLFANLPPGRYAVSVFHDENGNGKLDTNVVGIPTERHGFSRGARGQIGPPGFADAAVELGADTTITIQLQ